MIKYIVSLSILVLTVACVASQKTVDSEPQPADSPIVIVVHGGAGTIKKKSMSAEQQAQYTKALEDALDAGYNILKNGGTSLNAVEAAVRILEDCPLFNAGRGSVYNHNGEQEMDAAIMDGSTLNCGAVAGIRNTKNPISAARLVMDSSQHILMAGDGARLFAQKHGAEMVDSTYFYNERRWKQLQKAIEKEKIQLDHDGAQGYYAPLEELWGEHKKFGTVGAVALDKDGNLAAATSTGGLTNKRFGRVGDSPLIGSGTYANGNCAISCTGHGEYFIKNVVAHDVAALYEYTNISLDSASATVINHKLKAQGGRGGLIAVDEKGNVTMKFNTRGMYRGWRSSADDGGSRAKVLIYKE